MNFNKNKNTILISHTDLDGSGCLILEKNFFKNYSIKRISYNAILATLKEIVAEVSNSKDYPQLVITDLKLAKEDFEYLYSIRHYFSHILLIDHHLYDFEVKSFDNLEILINQRVCATMLTFLYFRNYCDLEKYKNFIKLVNIFDLWNYTHAEFKEAQDLNRLYWYLGARIFENRFLHTPQITPSLRESLAKIKANITNYFTEMLRNGKIHWDENITLSLCDEYITELKDYFNSKVYINLRNSYHYSIRLSENIDEAHAKKLREVILNSVDDSICINKGGHLRAFGITMEKMDKKVAQKHTEKIAKNVLKYLN